MQDIVRHLTSTNSREIAQKTIVRLSQSCPLAPLNVLLPDGISVVSSAPTLDLNGLECFEALQSWSIAKQVDVMEVLFSQGVPDAIGSAYLSYGAIVLPAQWVEVANHA